MQLQGKLMSTVTKRVLRKAKGKWLTALVMTAAVGSLGLGEVTVAADEVATEPDVAVITEAPIDMGAVEVEAEVEQVVSDEVTEMIDEANNPILLPEDNVEEAVADAVDPVVDAESEAAATTVPAEMTVAADGAASAGEVIVDEPADVAVSTAEITGVESTVAEADKAETGELNDITAATTTMAATASEPASENKLPPAAQLNRKAPKPKDPVDDIVDPDLGGDVDPDVTLETYPIVTNIKYGVEAGDTLASVAEKFDTTAAAIAAASGIRRVTSKLRPGMVLTIPSAEAKPMAIAESYDERWVVMLDPGHGGTDPGAVNTIYGIEEADLNLNLANILTLKLDELGFEVLTTRTGDETVDFATERSAITNASDADIFISLHHNASLDGEATGIETYYYRFVKGYDPQINVVYHNHGQRITDSAYLASLVQADLIAATGAVDRGVKTETFAVLRETAIPAILVEFGFMDNEAEFANLTTEAYQMQLADAVVKAVVTYFTSLY